MKLQIVQCGEPVLRQPARAVALEDVRGTYIQNLIEHMVETMRDAPGVGLAAPQIGESLQLAVIEDRVDYHQKLSAEQLRERERVPVPLHVIINPAITYPPSRQIEFFEGCLSLTGFTALVPRASVVEVACLNERGESQVIQASGWFARILQHEIDHLHGKLYVDRMYSQSFMTTDAYTRHWQQRQIDDVLTTLDILDGKDTAGS